LPVGLWLKAVISFEETGTHPFLLLLSFCVSSFCVFFVSRSSVSTGGQSIYGAVLKDENFERKHSSRGCLAMANRGPNTASSQFYITFIPTPHLNNKVEILRFFFLSLVNEASFFYLFFLGCSMSCSVKWSRDWRF
jgi:hypothetical protein